MQPALNHVVFALSFDFNIFKYDGIIKYNPLSFVFAVLLLLWLLS